MAHVSTAGFYDRCRLPHSINTQSAKLSSPVRRWKSDFSTRSVIKRDVHETLQQAALINIVAAVNEDIHGDSLRKPETALPGSAIDSLKNTVAVISNLVTPRNRSVSIPKQQEKVLVMTDDIVQKKPMYYRHSDDSDRIRATSSGKVVSSKGRVKTKHSSDMENACPSSVQCVKIMPVKSTYNDTDFKIIEANLRKSSNKTASYSECPQSAKASPTSVRKLGVLKKSKERTLHGISKCDAVDLMDTANSSFDTMPGEDNDPAKAILDDSRKIIPRTLVVPYARPKSLPGAFPAKPKKIIRTKSSPPGKQHIYKNKNPIARSISKDNQPSMYGRMMSLPGGFGFESLAIGNGVNQEPDVFSTLTHDSDRAPNPKIAFTSLALHRRRTGTPRTPITYNWERENSWSIGSAFHEHHTDITPEPMSRPRETIESVMGRETENKENEYTITPSKYKTNYMQPETSRRTPRKVKFDSREIGTNYDENNANYISKHIVNGGSSIIQMPVSVFRSYSPAIQPMSAHELLRFRQRIFPANMQQQPSSYPPFFTTSSVLNIKQFHQRYHSGDPVKQDDTEIHSICDERDAESDANLEDFMADCVVLDKADDIVLEEKAVDNEKTHSIKGKTVVSDELHDPTEKEDYYKLIKAIDTHDYAGFEHKKLRKHSDMAPKKGIEEKKELYVKVKVG